MEAPEEGGTHPLGRVDEEHDAIRDAKAGCHLVRKIHMTFKKHTKVGSEKHSEPWCSSSTQSGKLWGSAGSSVAGTQRGRTEMVPPQTGIWERLPELPMGI